MLTLIQRQDSSPMEGLDHLFLLPERALTMDATRLQKDLAGLDFDVRLLHEAPMGNIWLSGSRPSSATKEDPKARLKTVKERQYEERKKKLEEIQEQALALQRFKEKKDMERRHRMDELKQKEEVKRQMVEDRKKAINDAERDRLESILKRNQEREARMEAKKRNERHSIVFAFGSSTPRMLQPTDSVGSFWGHRRATSTQNITCAAAPLTRRQSERELDGGSKKRATSAGGLERSIEVTTPQPPAGCASGYVGRRRTDLMPTIPSRDSPSAPPRKSFTRSPAPSRPSSSLSQQSTSSVTSSVNMRTKPIAAPRRPRPVSIAVTGITNELKNGMVDTKKSETKPPLPKTRKSSLVKSTEKLKKKSATSPTEGSPKLLVSPTNAVPVTHSPVENKSIVKETKTVTKEIKTIDDVVQQTQETIVEHHEHVDVSNEKEIIKTEIIASQQAENELSTSKKVEDSVSEEIEETTKTETPEVKFEVEKTEVIQKIQIKQDDKDEVEKVEVCAEAESISDKFVNIEKSVDIQPELAKTIEKVEVEKKTESANITAGELNDSVTEMSTSITKIRINTEEEAKAALAERRRLAREEAERQAEMERRRIEEEQRLELERQQREEEQQRILIEKLRAEEQQRLEEAIKEAQKREEEERLRKEEENRMKLLKEEAERRAREEAERQKAELQERLKNEEKEREARRKRVEAIMVRTRAKNSSTTTQQTEEKNDDNKSEKINGSKGDAAENGHKNGKELDTVDNIIPVETLKNANTVNNIDNLSTDDTLNSNNAWQHNTSVDVSRHF